MMDGTRVRIWRAEVPVGYRAPFKAAPGAVIGFHDRGLLVSTRDNALLITELQIEDEPAMRPPLLEQRFRRYVGTSFSASAL